MKTLLWTALAVATATACSRNPATEVVDAAAEALGGRDRVLAVRTLTMEGGGSDGAIGGSDTPEAAPNTFKVTEYTKTLDLENGRMRMQQVRTAQFVFSAAVVTRQNQGLDGDVAFNIGQNGTASRVSEAAARARRFEMLQHPITAVRAALESGARVSSLREGEGSQQVEFTTAGGDVVTLTVDPATRLPTRVSIPSYDPNWGDILLEAQFSEYENVGGLQVPRRIVTTQDNWMTTDRQAKTVIDGPIGDLTAPDAAKDAPLPVPEANVTVEEVAPGIWWLAGGTHHSVVFEFDDHLKIFEVPLTEARTRAVIETARSLSPGKPVTHAIVSHHHLDHSGGVRTAVAEGLVIVMQRRNADFFRDILTRPHTRGADALARNPRPFMFELVDDQLIMKDDTTEVHLYRSNDNVHARLNMFAWVPRDRIVVQADFFDLAWLWHPWGQNWLDNLAARKLNPARHLPIHGRMHTHEELLATLKKMPTAPPQGFLLGS